MIPKKEHRKVHAVEVEDDGELFVGYFHRPSIDTLSAVNKLSKTDEIKSSTAMLDNCWLGGDPVIKSDTMVRMAAIKQLGEMFNQVVGMLKKLVEAHQLSTDDDEQYIRQGVCLIRANFHINPYELTPEQWAERFTEATWIENTRLENLAKILAKLFASEEN